ncbi:MAG: molybdopterin-dependent oxidoreductase [Anaerolineales bacterium]|nr:molybdopterin-dependent oxidoreductase [Anaerolineales bacterium]
MSEQVSRRDFLKLAGLGAATTAILTGCGPASRYVKREPYQQMPEYNLVGQSTYYATTCRECAAGCGLVVRTYQGRAIKTEGNAHHPLNLGKTCARGQATLHGLYNPDRVQGPSTGSWDAGIQAVADAFKKYKPSEIAFLMGMTPDHLYDLVSDLAQSTGMNAPLRYGALGMFESRATLSKAAENVFGQAGLPWFDVGKAQIVFSFGANFLETWLSPLAYTRGFAGLREKETKLRGTFVQFESRMSATGAKADKWIPIRPGTEGLVALAIGRLVSEIRSGAALPAFANVDPAQVADEAGIKLATLEELASMFVNSNVLAIPGGAALGQTNGLEIAEAVLTLNALSNNFGKPGGVYLSALAPNQEGTSRPASPIEMYDLVEKMKSGAIKALFVHGVNPIFELPKTLGFEAALANVELYSFATFPDETAAKAKYLLPDHHSLESWGYQRVATGVALPVLSGSQPVVSPYYDTRATADVLIAAAQAAGGKFASALPYKDEVDFIQNKVASLVGDASGSFSASDTATFMARFQQYGGWFRNVESLIVPDASKALYNPVKTTKPSFAGNGEFFFVPFVSPTLAEAGANKPWLQELPDPTTTVMWNTWVEINPDMAKELGLANDDRVRITSEAGSVEAFVYLYPAIRPDTVAMPFGQGHTAYGRYAENRGANPADLFGAYYNDAGDLAFAGMKVKIEKISHAVKNGGLSRMESLMGVYGEGLGGEEH